MEITTLAIDLAKRSFQLHGADSAGRAVLKKKISREKLLEFTACLKPCTIAMEVCSGANFWGRKFKAQGHAIRIIAPQFVKPFVKSQKNDANDAEAIAEAAQRPQMRFVALKEEYQQDIQSYHRVRERLVRNRVALTNEIHGLVHEYGIVLPKVRSELFLELHLLVGDESEFSDVMKSLLRVLIVELKSIEEGLKIINDKLKAIAEENVHCKRLMTIPGIGPTTATAIYSAVGDIRQFENSRALAAWLGLVPRQHSTGGKTKLLGITKSGNRYLRTLLIHGARAVVTRVKNKSDRLSKWIEKMAANKGLPKTYVALANKNARIIWAVWSKQEDFKMIA